jgi:hypothetical protein
LGTALVIGGVALVNSRFGSRRLYGRANAGGTPTPVEPTQRADATPTDR